MNKDQFWQMIETVNRSFPNRNRTSRLCRLEDNLLDCSLEDIADWHLIFAEYSNAAYRNELWAACAALGAHYTDDGFVYFRSWLISCGKDIYMNAMRNPDSLASVPLKGEKLNFEEFAYAAYHAYKAKLTRMEQQNEMSLIKSLNAYTLSPETKMAILEELPKRPDIEAGWQLWALPELFPNICKAKAPKDIKELLATGNIVFGYVHRKGTRTQYVFHFTAENIANFIGSQSGVSAIIVTDVCDRLILNTVGNFIDKCPDKLLLEKVKKALVPIQLRVTEAQPFFCPLRHEVEKYCRRRNIWL